MATKKLPIVVKLTIEDLVTDFTGSDRDNDEDLSADMLAEVLQDPEMRAQAIEVFKKALERMI